MLQTDSKHKIMIIIELWFIVLFDVSCFMFKNWTFKAIEELQETVHAVDCSVDVLVQVDATKHTLAKYLMELTITEYDMVHLLPSQIAAAALYLSIKLLDNSPWVSQICCQQALSSFD